MDRVRNLTSFLLRNRLPFGNTLLNELHEKLNEALLKLSDKHRTIVVLYEIDGLSHKEIATIMKCTEGTVRSRLHYAKIQLQSLLSDYLK